MACNSEFVLKLTRWEKLAWLMVTMSTFKLCNHWTNSGSAELSMTLPEQNKQFQQSESQVICLFSAKSWHKYPRCPQNNNEKVDILQEIANVALALGPLTSKINLSPEMQF